MYIYGSYKELTNLCTLARVSGSELIIFADGGDVWFLREGRDPVYFKTNFFIPKDVQLNKNQLTDLLRHIEFAKKGFDVKAEEEDLIEYKGEVVRVTSHEIILDERYVYKHTPSHSNAYAHEIRRLKEYNLQCVNTSKLAVNRQCIPIKKFHRIPNKISTYKKQRRIVDGVPATREPLEVCNEQPSGITLRSYRFPDVEIYLPKGYGVHLNRKKEYKLNYRLLQRLEMVSKIVSSECFILHSPYDGKLVVEMYDNLGKGTLHFRAVYDEKTLTLRSVL